MITYFIKSSPNMWLKTTIIFPCSHIYRSAEYWLTHAGFGLGLVPLARASHRAKLSVNRMRKCIVSIVGGKGKRLFAK